MSGETAGSLNFRSLAYRQSSRQSYAVGSERCWLHFTALGKHFCSNGTERKLIMAHAPYRNGVRKCINWEWWDLVEYMVYTEPWPNVWQQGSFSQQCAEEDLLNEKFLRDRMSSRTLPDNSNPRHLWKGPSAILERLRHLGVIDVMLLLKAL